MGLGRVTYRSVHISGLAEPQEAGVGVAAQLTDQLLLAIDLKWLNWSGVLKRSTLSASQPDNAAAPPSLAATSSLNWRDQFVVAFGAAYDLSPETVFWAGYNYGRDPIPAATLSPLLAAIGQHHFTVGLRSHVSESLMLGASLEYLLPIAANSTDTELPLSANLRVSTGYLAFHAGLKWVWRSAGRTTTRRSAALQTRAARTAA
jgi:long-chain fatty acid transport protein